MEDIKSKAHDDELNKSEEEFGDSCEKNVPTPKKVIDNFFKCHQCGKIFDARKEGKVTNSVNLCDDCI